MAAEFSADMAEERTIIAINQAQTTDSEQRNALKRAAEHFSLNFNNSDLFLVAARQSFEEDNASTVLEILQDPEHRDLLHFVGWDLVKIVFQFLPNENSEYMNILLLICDICNPREICLGLGELFSLSITWPKFIILIGLFQLVCQRLKGKVAKIFSSILSSLTRCLTTSGNKFDHLLEILGKILEFLKPHVEKIRRGCSGTQLSESPGCEDIEELKNVLKLFLIGLLEFPILSIDISASTQPDIPRIDQDSNDNYVSFREIAKTIVEYLGYMECNSFKHLFEYGVNLKKQMKISPGSIDSDSSDEDSSRLSYLGIGCLAFLVLAEGIGSSFLPVVITGKRSLETILVYIIPMLTTGQNKVVSKGLKLLLAILNMIESATLDHRLLEDGELLSGILTQLMTHCEDVDIRRDAVQGLRRIFDTLERRGRYGLLRSLHQGCVHSALAELLVLILKDEIAKSLQEDVDNQWFVGSNIADFLREVFRIPTKVLQLEDGIVEERNRVLSSLNLFRFLLIRDHGNKTGVHTMASEVEKSYLKPLTEAVSFSKMRLKVLMKEKRDEMMGERPVEESDVRDEIFSATTPDGRKLEKGSLQDQLQSLQFANLTVDMIDSVLARIREICAEKRKERATLE